MESSVINLKVLAALSLGVSRVEGRSYLRGVCVEFEARASTYIVTDGRILFAYRSELQDKEQTMLIRLTPTATSASVPHGWSNSGLSEMKPYSDLSSKGMARAYSDVHHATQDQFGDNRKARASAARSLRKAARQEEKEELRRMEKSHEL